MLLAAGNFVLFVSLSVYPKCRSSTYAGKQRSRKNPPLRRLMTTVGEWEDFLRWIPRLASPTLRVCDSPVTHGDVEDAYMTANSSAIVGKALPLIRALARNGLTGRGPPKREFTTPKIRGDGVNTLNVAQNAAIYFARVCLCNAEWLNLTF